MNKHLIFKAFRAINDPVACGHYKEGHVSVLRDYGITNITSNSDEWMQNPNMYCIVAYLEEDAEIVGGIRVQISDESSLLPVEKAIGRMDGRIHDIVKKFRDNGGVGELCALWNAKKIAGLGISVLLTRAGISISNQLDMKTMVGICADYTLKMFQKVGFVIDHSLGVNGEFAYPNETYVARVLGIMNAETLDTADDFDKTRMSSLRLNPVQVAVENGTRQQLTVKYELMIKK